MEFEEASPKPGVIYPYDHMKEPDEKEINEKEISDEDDDDRNHKHRRRDTQSQSFEGVASEQFSSRHFRKRNRPFENGYSFREIDSQSRENYKSYNNGPSERDFPVKYDKNLSSITTFVRPPSEIYPRNRYNQSFFGDTGSGWGRGRDPIIGSVDLASQMFHQGPVIPSIFTGRRMPSVSNAQNPSWGTFGLIPGMPIGGLDTLHSLGLQGTLIPPMNPSMNMGNPNQRCRDFEERGFCLRGEMCPMEHGINRIVVEDVQSLSQFNLPGSLPNVNIPGNAVGAGPRPEHDLGLSPIASAPASSLIPSKNIHNKSSKLEDRLNLNGAFSGSAIGSGADSYDPDRPLWNNVHSNTSTAHIAVHFPKIDEPESLLGAYSSDHHFGTANCPPVSSHATNSSLCERLGGSKSKIEWGTTRSSSDEPDKEAMEDQEAPNSIQDAMHQGRRPKAIDFSSGMQANANRNIRKPSQRALRTLFVNRIPQTSNRINALFSHFRKFGEVTDIFIPSNTERAFVQFSKREEAEAALVAPDAVMGNRFIKLWWANRDRSSEDCITSGKTNISRTPCTRGNTSNIIPLPDSKATKDSVQPVAPKLGLDHPSDIHVPEFRHSMSHSSSSPKAAASPSHKKLENLELLKEQLRKKQEMLDQKRNDFRLQLNKFEKATGSKGEVVGKQGAKKQKSETISGFIKEGSLTSKATSAPPEMMMKEDFVSPNLKTGVAMTLQPIERPDRNIYPSSSPVGSPSPINKFKLDNRPTSFHIIPPLPATFANVSVIKEHFVSYGDVSSVGLIESEVKDGDIYSGTSAVVDFASRQAAELAFVNGRCWEDHTLEFKWSDNRSIENLDGEKSPPVLETLPHSSGKLECAEEDAILCKNGKTLSSE